MTYIKLIRYKIMPKLAKDYSKSVIYKLVSNNLAITDKYIGSTTNFTIRKALHKYGCNKVNSKLYNYPVYKFIREHGGWDTWSMILLEKYPCNDGHELRARERDYYDLLGGELNVAVPAQTMEEYQQINRIKINQHRHKPYNCECGGKYVHINRTRHFNSKKHQLFKIADMINKNEVATGDNPLLNH